ncbi:hypothetical protein Riv7116_1743 [Rivularia sp. PCC 7116]|nr:hypothetical protein Riv7116_1743 [Rivularia sp. PCC 7116]
MGLILEFPDSSPVVLTGIAELNDENHDED